LISIRNKLEENEEFLIEQNEENNRLDIPLFEDKNYFSNFHNNNPFSSSKQIVTTASTPSVKKEKQFFDFPKIQTINPIRNYVHTNSIRCQDRVKIKKTVKFQDKTNELRFHSESGNKYMLELEKKNLGSQKNNYSTKNNRDDFVSYSSSLKNYNKDIPNNFINQQNHYRKINSKDDSSEDKSSNILLIRRLMHSNPYKDVPKKVKYSFFNTTQLEKKSLVNIPSKTLTKQGHQLKDTGTSSILYKPKSTTQNLLIKLLTLSNDNPSKIFVKSVKMKSIKWIIKNKCAYVELLINSYKDIKWFLYSRGGELDKASFNEFLLLFDKKGGNDQEFTDLIFLIFDENMRGIINYKEVIIWFILYNNDAITRKIENMIDICLIENSSNLVNKEEFFRLLKSCMLNGTLTKRLQSIIQNILIDFKSSEFEKYMMYRELISNDEFKSYLCRNSKIANELENQFDEEIETISNMNLKRSKYFKI